MDSAQRKILGALAVVAVFGIIGEYSTPGKTTNPAKIIFAGTIAAAILTEIAELGEIGERFALGLAALAATTSVLVYGGPVWNKLNGYLGTGVKTVPTTPAPTVTAGAQQIAPAAAAAALAP